MLKWSCRRFHHLAQLLTNGPCCQPPDDISTNDTMHASIWLRQCCLLPNLMALTIVWDTLGPHQLLALMEQMHVTLRIQQRAQMLRRHARRPSCCTTFY